MSVQENNSELTLTLDLAHGLTKHMALSLTKLTNSTLWLRNLRNCVVHVTCVPL